MKKGLIFAAFTDLMGWLLLLLGIFIWMIILVFNNERTEYRVTERIDYLSNKEILINILRTPVRQDITYSDILSEAYLTGETDAVRAYTQYLLDESFFGSMRSVCWNIYIDDRRFINENCGETVERAFFDAETYLPLPNRQVVKVRLEVPGFIERL
ncbi:hypothetical protein JW930_00090 [Candidatus Woesearchaeota archaeon]|nr:hypothetical protein [Candidatus Woesearchaeota archaeon]